MLDGNKYDKNQEIYTLVLFNNQFVYRKDNQILNEIYSIMFQDKQTILNNSLSKVGAIN